jgi:hypothetical protein
MLSLKLFEPLKGEVWLSNRMQHYSADLHKSDDFHGVDASHDAKLASHMGSFSHISAENVG